MRGLAYNVGTSKHSLPLGHHRILPTINMEIAKVPQSLNLSGRKYTLAYTALD